MEDKTYTLKDIQRETNAPAWLIYYLRNNNRLPVAQASPGRGFSTYYKKEAVEVINKYLSEKKSSE